MPSPKRPPAPRPCPSCAGRNVRRSSRQNVFERVISLARVLPYRCLDCNRRFFARG